MPESTPSSRTKKIAVVLGTVFALAVIITSGVVLANSAKLRIGSAPAIAGTAEASALKVNTSQGESALATSDTTASSTLQGARSNGSANTTSPAKDSRLSVKPTPANASRACDAIAQAKLTNGFQSDKEKETNYHNSMMKMLQNEGMQVKDSEDNRYDMAMDKLKSALNNNLAGIACPGIK